MAVITTGNHIAELWPGIQKIYGKTYKEKPMVCEKLFTMVKSNKAYELYHEQTGLGYIPKKPENTGIAYDTDQAGVTTTLRNHVYSGGVQISEEAIADNQYESVAKSKAKKLARALRQTEETVFANVLNNGFTAAYAGGDGKELMATDHPTINGTQSNELAVAADLSEASIEDMLTQIRLMLDSRGMRIQLSGEMIIVPPQMEFEVKRILGSTLRSGSANNDINAMKSMNSLPQGTVVWDYLTDPDAWFIKTDADTGLIRQINWDKSLKQDNDFGTGNARMKISKRFAAGWADWRAIVGSPGA